MSKKVPILFVIFNRPETEAQVFNRIREYQPDKLYVAADGPRKGKAGEEEKCHKARAIIQGVDWPCEVKTLFREENLGCALGVSSAITWFYENEDFGCVIEDDVLPSIDFFVFCENALPKYQDNEKVMLISAFNPESNIPVSSTCGFSRYANIWGWASWRRAWNHYDLEMRGPLSLRLSRWVEFYGLFLGVYLHYCCHQLYRSFLKTRKWHTWDYQWTFSLLQNDGLSLVPYVNLSKNVGIGVGDGTHYAATAEDPYVQTAIGHFLGPFSYPVSLKPDTLIERWTYKQVARARVLGIKARLFQLLHIN